MRWLEAKALAEAGRPIDAARFEAMRLWSMCRTAERRGHLIEAANYATRAEYAERKYKRLKAEESTPQRRREPKPAFDCYGHGGVRQLREQRAVVDAFPGPWSLMVGACNP